MDFTIRVDDLSGPEIAGLIADHKALMLKHSPPESSHALLLDGLRAPEITVWTMWTGAALLGCGALKEMGERSGEIKSMHTRADRRGAGLGKVMLEHILAEARARGLTALYLETGSMAAFHPAQRLYERAGFAFCEPFGDYTADPNSVFMVKFIG
jgi:putative acetyltransferase